MVAPENRIASALEERNRILREQIEVEKDLTIAIEDLTTAIRNG